MERYVKSLDRASKIFKVLTVFVFLLGIFRLAVVLLPSLGLAGAFAGSGVMGSASAIGVTAIGIILAAAGELLSVTVIVFSLFTVSLVLEFLAQLGEDMHILRRSDWERRQVAGGRTQRMD